MLNQNNNLRFNNAISIRLGDNSLGVPVSVEVKKKRNKDLYMSEYGKRPLEIVRGKDVKCLIPKQLTEKEVCVEFHSEEEVKPVIMEKVCEEMKTEEIVKVEQIYTVQEIVKEENPLRKVVKKDKDCKSKDFPTEPKLKAIVDLVWSREKLNRIISNKKW